MLDFQVVDSNPRVMSRKRTRSRSEDNINTKVQPLNVMSQNKRRKMDPSAACSSTDGCEPNIAHQCSSNEHSKTIFNPNYADFREAVKWSGFVDRSLLIKELLSKDGSMIIFAPRRFGKSMNLSMVKRFFEIEKGRDVINAPQDFKELEHFENFKAFNRYGMESPCKILAEENLAKEHFGRHPVVHINFKDVCVSSIQDVKYSVKEVVHEAYQTHSYLKRGEIFSDPSDNKDANKLCNIWCDPEEYKNEQAIEGMRQLIKYLYYYHKRKVYLLVDEFDAPAVKALLLGESGNEVRVINGQVIDLLDAVVKGKVAEEYLLGSLITGVSYLSSVGISEALNNVPVHKWLSDEEQDRFSPYYGLRQDELITLLEHVFPDQEQKRDSIQQEVKNLYNGYSFRDEPLYCLWSVLHYIEKRSTLKRSEIFKTTFWADSSIISKMGSILRKGNIRTTIINVMGGDYISFSPSQKVDANELANFLNENESCALPSLDDILTFFLEQGYLARVQCENVCNKDENIFVKIPNTEVLVAFRRMFRNYLVKYCGFDHTAMTDCAQVFKYLPTYKDDEIFKKKMGDLYNHLATLLKALKGQEGLNERSLQAALYIVLFSEKFDECCIEKYVVEGSKNSGKIDLWLRHPDFTGMFEMKFCKSDNKLNESSQEALEQIVSGGQAEKIPYVLIFGDKYPYTVNYVLIGITMSNNAEVGMCCLVNSLDVKDCIRFP